MSIVFTCGLSPYSFNDECAVQIVEFQSSRGGLTDVEKPNDLFRIAFIERKHKRRIVNFEELVASCNLWQLPEGTKYKRVECWAINLDSSDKYLENISQLRSVDALVSFVTSACEHDRGR